MSDERFAILLILIISQVEISEVFLKPGVRV
jgi:hypothetical protein